MNFFFSNKFIIIIILMTFKYLEATTMINLALTCAKVAKLLRFVPSTIKHNDIIS